MTIKEAFPDAMAARTSSPTVLKQISYVSPLSMFIRNENIYTQAVAMSSASCRLIQMLWNCMVHPSCLQRP